MTGTAQQVGRVYEHLSFRCVCDTDQHAMIADSRDTVYKRKRQNIRRSKVNTGTL